MRFSDENTLLYPVMNSELPFVAFMEQHLHANAASKKSACV